MLYNIHLQGPQISLITHLEREKDREREGDRERLLHALVSCLLPSAAVAALPTAFLPSLYLSLSLSLSELTFMRFIDYVAAVLSAQLTCHFAASV